MQDKAKVAEKAHIIITTVIINFLIIMLLTSVQINLSAMCSDDGVMGKDGISITVLAQTEGLSKPTMTPLLRRLELLGYVNREYLAGDDPQKCISLTKLGRSFAEEANQAAKEALCATGLKDNEAEQLIRLCTKIKTSLSNYIR